MTWWTCFASSIPTCSTPTRASTRSWAVAATTSARASTTFCAAPRSRTRSRRARFDATWAEAIISPLLLVWLVVVFHVDVNVVLEARESCVGLRHHVGTQQKIHSFFQKGATRTAKVVKRSHEESTIVVSGVWACAQCTFHNPVDKEYCEMCGARRKRREKEETTRIDSLFGGKRHESVPLCSGHHLPCVRHQGGKRRGR